MREYKIKYALLLTRNRSCWIPYVLSQPQNKLRSSSSEQNACSEPQHLGVFQSISGVLKSPNIRQLSDFVARCICSRIMSPFECGRLHAKPIVAHSSRYFIWQQSHSCVLSASAAELMSAGFRYGRHKSKTPHSLRNTCPAGTSDNHRK